MKKTAIQTFLLSLLIIFNLSCAKKDRQEKEIDVDNLTPCQSNKTCQYLFAENADIDGYNRMKAGSYRVFWANQKDEISDRIFYIRTPMKGDKFELGKAEILRGDVKYLNACPTCNTIPLKAVDGYLKGVNLTPGKQADQTKWLLEAKIILKDEIGGTTYRDTVYVKQYFYPNFVYN